MLSTIRIAIVTKMYIARNTIGPTRGNNTIPYKLAHLVTFESLKWKYIFFRDQQHIVYESRLIAIREVSPPFGEEHRGLEQDITFPANNHLLILGKYMHVRCPHKRIVTITKVYIARNIHVELIRFRKK